MSGGTAAGRKTALIAGITGQDGAYLARLLLEKGYRVVGTSRDGSARRGGNLARVGIEDRVSTVSMSVTDFRSVLQAVSDVAPDEIYNLAGQSSVGLSFELPVETLESISVATLNFLEVIRYLKTPIRFYSAGSSETFGNTDGRPANERTAFEPRSPYAVAKAAAFWQVANYREAYALHACTGILFNHESPLRGERFVTQKIVRTACRIAAGSGETLRLGNVEVMRDWGWAPEYVEAMWRMLQRDEAQDYVIATGQSSTLREFVDAAFTALGLQSHEHVLVDPALYRPTDLAVSRADPAKAARELGWTAEYRMAEVVTAMVEAERKRSRVG